jgi:hypothetical protein
LSAGFEHQPLPQGQCDILRDGPTHGHSELARRRFLGDVLVFWQADL